MEEKNTNKYNNKNHKVNYDRETFLKAVEEIKSDI